LWLAFNSKGLTSIHAQVTNVAGERADVIVLDEGGAMKLRKSDIRVCSSLKIRTSFLFVLLPLMSLFWIRLQPANAQQADVSGSAANAPLKTEQIVENLVAMNLKRAQALHAYQGTRVYPVEYHGFPGTRSAEMIVDVRYQSPGTKEFTIPSSSGSKLIIDKVFKKLLLAEKEAMAMEMQKCTALNGDNYDFTLVGYESTPSSSRYVLIVDPKTKDKFLYRGRIWIDAEDFAVVRLKAKNPSFWTKNSEIEQVYMKVSHFWLPARNHSVSAIRLGGHADLMIEYTDYQITSATPVSTY